jgi:hypothetical protein
MKVLTIKTQEEFDSKIIDKRFYYDGNVIFECNIDSPKVKIDVRNIQARNIEARNIDARNINAWNIDSRNINACNIDACDIKALDISARDIEALNINAFNIDADNIDYHAVCFTYCKLKAITIKGRLSKSRHFSLTDDLEIG